MKNGTTICSKHDDIINIAQSLLENAEEDNVDTNSFCDDIRSLISIAEDAKEDGQSMERALIERKRQVEELDIERDYWESEAHNYEAEAINLQEEIDSLHEQYE